MTGSDPENLGERIAHMRNLKGLTQQQLAHHVGLGRGTIAGIETGRQDTTLPHLRQIAATLNVTIGQLVGETPLPTPPEVTIDIRVTCTQCGTTGEAVATHEQARLLRQAHISDHLKAATAEQRQAPTNRGAIRTRT